MRCCLRRIQGLQGGTLRCVQAARKVAYQKNGRNADLVPGKVVSPANDIKKAPSSDGAFMM